MPTQTFEPISSGSFAGGYTSGTINLPTSNYTDLVLIMNNSGSGADNGWITLNGDTSRAISWVAFGGRTSISKNSSSNPSILYSIIGAQYAEPAIFYFPDYRNTSYYKTCIMQVASNAYGMQTAQFRYPNTAALTSMEIRTQTYASMGTGGWYLYGITRA